MTDQHKPYMVADMRIVPEPLDNGRVAYNGYLPDDDGNYTDWMVCYVDPPEPRTPLQTFYCDSLDSFHRWVRWARS